MYHSYLLAQNQEHKTRAQLAADDVRAGELAAVVFATWQELAAVAGAPLRWARAWRGSRPAPLPVGGWSPQPASRSRAGQAGCANTGR
jgi:hypothetical protein